jgi:hypothetical protein
MIDIYDGHTVNMTHGDLVSLQKLTVVEIRVWFEDKTELEALV